jgi:hypothetical protein
MNPPFHPPSVCPSANLSPFHLPHTETRQWAPPPFISFHDIYASPGAFINHWGTRFCILYIFPTFIYYFVVQTPLIPNLCFCRHRWRPAFLSWPYATHVTLGWSITPHLPSPASSMTSEYYPGHLPFIL